MSISRLNSGGSIRLNNQPQHTRQTPNNSFGAQIQRGVANGAGAMSHAANVAAPFVPGGTVVAATLNGFAGQSTGQSQQQMPSGTPDALTGENKPSVLEQTKALQEQGYSQNMQYLQLQTKMQNESRQFTTISNIMKVRYETQKSSINNIR